MPVSHDGSLGKNKNSEEIGKGNQITAPRFQTGGRHQTSMACLPLG